MYKNIGKKIKALAKVICIIGIIASFLAGIALIISGMVRSAELREYSDYYYSRRSADTVLLTGLLGGLGVIVLGSISSWLSTLLLYGFGQQVDMQEKSANLLEEIHKTLRPAAPAAPPYAPAPYAPAPYAPSCAPVSPAPPAAPRAASVEVAPPAAPAEPVPQAQTCPICNTPLAPGATFCTACGNKL